MAEVSYYVIYCLLVASAEQGYQINKPYQTTFVELGFCSA